MGSASIQHFAFCDQQLPCAANLTTPSSSPALAELLAIRSECQEVCICLSRGLARWRPPSWGVPTLVITS